MRARPLWVVAAFAYLAWILAVATFWALPGPPISPLRLLAVVVLFYIPAAWIGPWATSRGQLAAWTGRDMILATAVTCLLYAPLGILTLPILPLTAGAVPVLLLLLGRGLVWLPKRAKAVAV